MSFTRFSDVGKEYLLDRMGTWAKSITAHLLANLTGITSDHQVIAMAMDEFPAIIRKQLAEVLDHIDSDIQAGGLLEGLDIVDEDRISKDEADELKKKPEEAGSRLCIK